MADFDERTRILIGDDGAAKLRAARVMVVGLGGVGGAAAEALARAGVGHLVVIDRDVVERSNINRQVLAFHSTLGQAKVDVAKEMIQDINPSCEVECLHTFLEREKLADQLASFTSCDFVIDAIDSISQKIMLAAWCQEHDIALVSSAGGANKLDPCKLEFSDLYKTTVCPMAKDMRKLAREKGLAGWPVLFSTERALRVDDPNDGASGERILGTMSYLPPIMGQMLASWVIRQLLKLDESSLERKSS